MNFIHLQKPILMPIATKSNAKPNVKCEIYCLIILFNIEKNTLFNIIQCFHYSKCIDKYEIKNFFYNIIILLFLMMIWALFVIIGSTWKNKYNLKINYDWKIKYCKYLKEKNSNSTI